MVSFKKTFLVVVLWKLGNQFPVLPAWDITSVLKFNRVLLSKSDAGESLTNFNDETSK